MNNKEEFFTFTVDQPHPLQLRYEEPDPAYKKAFLSPDENSTSEYARNTTTWD